MIDVINQRGRMCGKLDPTTSRGRTSLTPNELNIELSYIFLFRFDLESSLERNVISYFYIRSCLIAYSFVQSHSGRLSVVENATAVRGPAVGD